MLTDVHGLLADLCLDPARPQITALAQAILRDCDSPYTPPALLGALDQVITQLTYAMRNAAPGSPLPPAAPPPLRRDLPHHARDGARSKENSRTPAQPKWGQIKGEQWGHLGLTKPPTAVGDPLTAVAGG